ncbi:MAG TPA: hypothetical protein VI542_33125 [Candidatus Tectomicrobia bacterium]
MPRPKPIYPPAWKDVSRMIRQERAQGRCECWGECGLHRTHPGPRRCVEMNSMPAVWARGRIVLTVAHLCACEPLCADPAHLKACCPRCHILIDLPLHLKHAAETRRQEKELLGQSSFGFMEQ